MNNIPRELCTYEGIIGDVARYVLAKSQRKHHEFALAAGLALVSVVCGRRVTDETRTTANLYLLMLGPTGCGKETPRRVLKEMLQPCDLLSSERFTSDSALAGELMARPSALCVADEIGAMITELADNRASSHVKNLADAMTQLYSSAGSTWNYKAYADPSRSKSVVNPNFVIVGSGNADSLLKALRPEKITDGFLGRFILFLSENGGRYADGLARFAVDENHPSENEYSPSLPVPSAVNEFISRWGVFKTHDGNLEDQTPTPKVIARSADARERLQSHYEAISERLADDAGIQAELWARAAEKTAKFALLAALSRGSDRIELRDADWAIALSNFLVRRLVAICGRHVAETSWDAKKLELLRRIEDHGRPIEHSELLRASRLKSKDFREYLSTLHESGDIKSVVRKTKGRLLTGYVSSAVALDTRGGWVEVAIHLPDAIEKARKKKA